MSLKLPQEDLERPMYGIAGVGERGEGRALGMAHRSSEQAAQRCGPEPGRGLSMLDA